METNTKSSTMINTTTGNRTKQMYLTYILITICLSDWIYKIFKIFISLNFLSILYYFSHLFHIWKTNIIVTTFIVIICLLGIPKFILLLKRSSNVINKLIKSFIKKPIIINVPIFIYLLIIIFKVSLFLWKYFLNDNVDNIEEDIFETEITNSYWQTIRESLKLYRYSTLITIVLFFLGIYTLVTNRVTQKLSKEALKIFDKQIKILRKFVSITIPTPMSMVILLSINLLIRLFPNVSLGFYHVLTSRSMFWFIIVCIGLYQFYKWYWPSSKYDIDLSGNINVNDVSKLNKTQIYSLFYPRTVNDIEYLVMKAKSQGKTISLRGQAHTMGGQTLPPRKANQINYVCDLKYLNRVRYNESTTEALVEAGATWTHVIKKLNSYGRSPVTMQSYCSFSVAGTISVNAHGITSDDAMYESVISMEYIDMNGKRGECSREINPELFSLMIGGYGLFGIITQLKLKTVPNVKTALEFIRLDSSRFSTYYDDFLNDPSIEIKIARVDLVHPNNILMFVFRQESGTTGTVAELNDEARVMHPRQHLIYTYLAQRSLFRRIRFTLEKLLARPLDLTYSTDRNTTMYESAAPMALLYQPLTYYDDTFILQEYFIPKENFSQWYEQLKPILLKDNQYVFLLNLTIRFVKKDQLTFLAYAKQSDSYAFVFYFRIKRNELGDQAVRDIHQNLIQSAFQCQGTFYLPYRQHYSYEQILQAYPMFGEFYEKKFFYDPMELFTNDWYEHYRPKRELIRSTYQSNSIELITDEFKIVEQRRMNSFYTVITNELLRRKFRKFLRTVFLAERVDVIFNYVNRATRNPLNKNDHDIYRELQNILDTRQFAFIRKFISLIKQVRQLRVQIKDLIRQQITIFKHLGYCGKIKDIVSIGDRGRCIKELREALKIKGGHVYIVNDGESWLDIIERNSLFPLGTHIPYDFSNLSDVPIPSESVDLVVCYMGLHHLPQDQLDIYFKMIYRILRPNGLFLFREHHAYEELKPLLDVAHMVFNVVTRVDYEKEINEIRAFRTIEQWRSLLRRAGFEDTFIYDEQEDDPTDDIMIVFRKPNNQNINLTNKNEIIEKGNYQKIIASPESNYFRPSEWLVVRIAIQFGLYLNHTTFDFFPYMKFLSIYWSLFRKETELAIGKYGFQTAVISSIGFVMNVIVGIVLTGAFIQLSFFAFLVRLATGSEQRKEYEQLIIEKEDNEEDFDFQKSIDSQIDNIQILKENQLYAIRVPRHIAFTSILKKLALNQKNKFNLISISGQTEKVQIELLIHNNDQQRLLWLKQRSNQEIVFEYTNPIDKTQICLFIRVDIQHLFEFIRDCTPFENDHSLTIVQIFDYYD